MSGGRMTNSHPIGSVLREKAREAIKSGRLPARAADRTLGGPGTGATCPVCAKPLRHDQMAREVQFKRSGATAGIDSYHLHPPCCMAWERERAIANEA